MQIHELAEFRVIQHLLDNKNVSEILINNHESIIYEENQILVQQTEGFKNTEDYSKVIEKFSQLCQTYLNRERPFIESQIGEWRLTMAFQEISGNSPVLSLRRHQKSNWTLKHLYENNWCSTKQFEFLQQLLSSKKNLLVVGPTSSGKTTALQALLNSTTETERSVILQDTDELKNPNSFSISLKARPFINQHIQAVSLSELVSRSLRLRPDRLIVGEVRGPEAYALLMALSTGHSGSMSTLHAKNAREALLRLEMLIQLGARQWSLTAIRRLIGLSLDAVLVVEKNSQQRRLKDIMLIRSVEETGVTLEKV